MTTILDLPEECYGNIIYNLDLNSLLLLSRTCTWINRCIDANYNWYLFYCKGIDDKLGYNKLLRYYNLYYYKLICEEFIEKEFDPNSDYKSQYSSLRKYKVDEQMETIDHFLYAMKGKSIAIAVTYFIQVIVSDSVQLYQDVTNHIDENKLKYSSFLRYNDRNVHLFNAYKCGSRSIVDHLLSSGIELSSGYLPRKLSPGLVTFFSTADFKIKYFDHDIGVEKKFNIHEELPLLMKGYITRNSLIYLIDVYINNNQLIDGRSRYNLIFLDYSLRRLLLSQNMLGSDIISHDKLIDNILRQTDMLDPLTLEFDIISGMILESEIIYKLIGDV